MQGAQRWAEEEFGDARLGDKRRTRRLVSIAAEVACRPAGVVSKACSSSASREGAFRLLENTSVPADAVQEAAFRATARRCSGQSRVVVAVDGSSLTLADDAQSKDLGGVGAWSKGARGVHAVSALALTPEGIALGVCSQQMWVRAERSRHASRRRARGASETDHWIDVLLGTRNVLSDVAPDCQPWFQVDRGGDCWQVLAVADRVGMLLTVRASYDRCVDAQGRHLWAAVVGTNVVATRRIDVPARPAATRRKRVGHRRRIRVPTPPRQARVAKVAIRAAPAPLAMTTPSGKRLTADFNAVYVKETGHLDDPLEWMLLTTHPIATRADVLEVVRAYALRWRVEEFHRTWKRGLCRVEDTQLRSRSAIFKWATILATVATRAMRLTQLARTTPDAPASSELSRTELRALFALREPKGVRPGDPVTLAQAVRWLADIGGYTGPWNGPPGATVIGRGLHDVLIAARAFANLRKKR